MEKYKWIAIATASGTNMKGEKVVSLNYYFFYKLIKGFTDEAADFFKDRLK